MPAPSITIFYATNLDLSCYCFLTPVVVINWLFIGFFCVSEGI